MSLKSTMEVKPPKDEQIHPQEKATPYPIPHPSLLLEHQIHHQNEEDSYLLDPSPEPEPEHTGENIVYNNDTIINNNNINVNNNANNNANANDLLLEDISEEDEAYLNSFPPGYRFSPHDDELIVDYLKKKVSNEPLPTNKIRSVDLYLYNPKMLIERLSENRLGEVENEWYFFTPRSRKYRNGSRPNRAAGGGFWKATGADKPVKHEGTLVGYRKALVFYEGKPPQGEKTSWIMHEYRVNEPLKPKRNGDDMRLDDWVLCKLHKKPDRFVKIARDDEEPPLVVNPNPLDQVPLPYHENNFEQCGFVVDPMEHFLPCDPGYMYNTDDLIEPHFPQNWANTLPYHFGSQRILGFCDITPQLDSSLQSFEHFQPQDSYVKRLKPSSPLKASTMLNTETVAQNVVKPQSKSQ